MIDHKTVNSKSATSFFNIITEKVENVNMYYNFSNLENDFNIIVCNSTF